MRTDKTLRFAKLKCPCGHVTLIPPFEVLYVFEPIKCERCGKVIAERNGDQISFLKERDSWDFSTEDRLLFELGS